jgi:hypothetical protein
MEPDDRSDGGRTTHDYRQWEDESRTITKESITQCVQGEDLRRYKALMMQIWNSLHDFDLSN